MASYHPPNLDAVQAIIDMAGARPEIGFLVGGSVCEAFWRKPLPSNVILLGLVSDAEKQNLLASADVAINPMRLGAGTNLKVLEYFAAGVPTVSTAVGARGIRAAWGRDLIVADIADFPTVLGRLVTGWSLDEMALRARGIALAFYDWHVLGDTLLRALTTAIPALADSPLSPAK